MTKRLWFLAFALIPGLLLAPVAPAAPAPAAAKARLTAGPPKDYTANKGLSQPTYKDIVTESYEVEMEDGIRIYVEVVRPKAKGRYGTILELSPYHGTLADRLGTRILPGPVNDKAEHVGMAGYFAPRGYAVVFADLRGTGRSEGCLDHMGPNDQSDAKTIVEWAAKQPWSNGRVGMTGHSYVGSTPQMAAAQKPKGLVTIVPSAGLAAMYHHEFQNGVPYAFQWLGPLFAYELLAMDRHLPPIGQDPASGGQTGDNFGNDPQYFGCGWTQSAATTNEAYFSGEETEWHRERDFRKGVTHADIPVFIVHGVNDNAARIAAIDWFNRRDGRAGDKAWIGQWDHGSGCCPNTRTCSATSNRPCEDDEWTTALHAWFDKHLLQRKVDTGPPVEVFLNNREVFTAPQWPPPAKDLKLFPRDDDTLGKEPSDEGTKTFIGDHRGFSNEFNTGNVSFQSDPFKKDTLIVGVPKMRLVVASSSPRVHINATLYDVAGDQADRIGRAGWAIQPELRDGWDNPQVVVPEERMTIDLEAMSQAHLIEKGHSLRLMITTSHPDKVPTFGGGAQITVYVGGDDGTHFTVPVIENPLLYTDPIKPLV